MCLLCYCFEIDGLLAHLDKGKMALREVQDEARQVYASMTPPLQEYRAAQKADDSKPYKSAS